MIDHRTAIALELYKWVGGSRTHVDCEHMAAGVEDALAKAGFGIGKRKSEHSNASN